MNKKIIKILTLLILTAVFAFAENNEAVKTETEDSEYEEKRNTILYGMGDDILELIKSLEADEDTRFDSDLQNIFTETKIPQLRQSLFAYFAKTENPCLKQDALVILENRHDSAKDTVSAAILYCRDLKIDEAREHLRAILKDEDYDYMTMAISALGKLGNAEDADFLAEFFQSEASEDEKQSLIIKQTIAATLEELPSENIWDFLIETASDTDENSIIRGSMAAALGKSGNEKAVPILVELFEDKDPILRVAAIKGLAKFSSKEASDVLLQGFKDSYYKVRLQAIQSAKETKRSDAIPYILYRAKNDPEVSIKYAAIEALSQFSSGETDKWLLDSFKSEKTGQAFKLKIAYFLLKNNFNLIYPTFEEETLKALNDKLKKKFAIELGKIASKIENSATAPIAENFLNDKDAIVISIGLDMFKKNEYPSLVGKVSEIAQDEKKGALSRRAKSLLERAGIKNYGESEKSVSDSGESKK